jgi:hypothetical protein
MSERKKRKKEKKGAKYDTSTRRSGRPNSFCLLPFCKIAMMRISSGEREVCCEEVERRKMSMKMRKGKKKNNNYYLFFFLFFLIARSYSPCSITRIIDESILSKE